ncbi:MAG: hypothetical protein WCT36_00090 [Candidatus Gracilibacteria bacterium]
MTTILIDKDTKDLASERAKRDRLSLSAVVRILLLDYADGKIKIGSHVVENINTDFIEVNGMMQRRIDNVVKKYENHIF